MEEINLEQPNLEIENDITNYSTDCDERSLEVQEGSMLGKFKDAKSLLDAYNNLEAEFTRKSQKLAEFQKKVEENANFENFQDLDEFLKSTTDSDKYKKEITEILANNSEICNLPNKYQVALLIVKEAKRKSANALTDQEFLDKNIYSNNEIKQKIITEYLSDLNNISSAPKVISGNSTSIYFSPNENKPKTLKEAGEVFSKMLK